jgi:hypothetical protein
MSFFDNVQDTVVEPGNTLDEHLQLNEEREKRQK